MTLLDRAIPSRPAPRRIRLAAIALTAVAMLGPAVVASNASAEEGAPIERSVPEHGSDPRGDRREVLGSLRRSTSERETSALTTFVAPRISALLDVVEDPAGDVAFSDGDILAAGIDAAPDGIVATAIVVESYEDPRTALNWVDTITGPAWDIDTNLDGTIDYTALAYSTGGDFVASVIDAESRTRVCDAVAFASPADSGYGVGFDVECIGNPESFAWGAAMGYENQPTDEWEVDWAPDLPYLSGPVPNEAWSPPQPDVATVPPARLLETRPGEPTVDGLQRGIGYRPAGSTTQVQVAGRGGIPTNATAAIVNVAAINPAHNGYLTLYACNQQRPPASTLNHTTSQTIANGATIQLGNGKLCIYNHRATHLILDVTGYVASP